MKNLIKVIFSGTAIGIALLMLGYVSIYYVSGQEIFAKEIVQLTNIETLQSQLMITGISGMLIALSIYYLENTMKQQETATYKIVLGAVLLTISAIFAMMLNERMNENISDMMVVISAILVCAYAFINSIRVLLYNMTINKETPQESEKGN